MKIRIVYNPVLKTAKLINLAQNNEITYNQTRFLGKYSPNSGNKISLDMLYNLIKDIARNYANEPKILISVYSNEKAIETIKSAIITLNDPRVIFNALETNYVFNEIKDTYSDLKCYFTDISNTIFDMFADDDTAKAKNIKKTVIDGENLKKDLEESDVVICVTGAYSTGKSTFINALFGKKLLPRSVNRETAKLCKIKKGTELKIKFFLENETSVTFNAFNVNEGKYNLATSEPNNPIIVHIQNSMKSSKIKDDVDAIHCILNSINEYYNKSSNKIEAINGSIELEVPYDILGGLNYVIYDTPGAGTSCRRDDYELRKIINSPLKPITIFLNTWDKLQEMSVSNLLYQIKENGNLEYAMYVVNQADTQPRENLEKLNTEITLQASFDDSEEEKLDMRDGQLFFVSSYGALVAQAHLDGINPQTAIDDSASAIEQKNNDESMGQYYKIDSIGGIDSTKTKALILECENEIEQSAKEENIVKQKGRVLMVNSGMFPLKNTIKSFATSNALIIKSENLYYEYRKILLLTKECLCQKKAQYNLDIEKKRSEAKTIENILIERVANSAATVFEHQKAQLNAEYIKAEEDFLKSVDKDNKLVTYVEKIKIEKIVKKYITCFRDLYLKMIYMMSRYKKIVKVGIFDFGEKKLTKAINKNIITINKLIEQLDKDYMSIRKRELKRFARKLVDEIHRMIDLNDDLSDETKTALKLISPNILEIEFKLKPFDFEQFQETKMRRGRVIEEVEKWYKESIEDRHKSYNKDFEKALLKIIDSICKECCNNMKEISEQLSAQLKEGFDLENEVAKTEQKIMKIDTLIQKLEVIIGNQI